MYDAVNASRCCAPVLRPVFDRFSRLESEELTPPERRFGSSPAVGDLGHRLIRAHPNSEGGELDGGEEVVVAFVVSRGDGSEMLEFVEEAFDGVALFVDSPVETEGDTRPAIGLI